MGWVAAAGSLVDTLKPFVETTAEKKEHEREMAQIDRDIAKYQAEVTQANQNTGENNSIFDNKLLVGGGLIILGYIGYKAWS